MLVRIADTLRESLKSNQISNLTIWINNTIPTDQKLKAEVIARYYCYWPAQNSNTARHTGGNRGGYKGRKQNSNGSLRLPARTMGKPSIRTQR